MREPQEIDDHGHEQAVDQVAAVDVAKAPLVQATVTHQPGLRWPALDQTSIRAVRATLVTC